jgi:hypothetical protein
MNGKGLLTLANGDIVDGVWEKGELKKTKILKQHGEIYEGQIENG